ncbi:bifunctional metallophosphatase/5'-nucleotidase [candidate division KSB1 bacterium]|nr:bifunctional metallophosphatase/5'-nucleotidase [candidate division KSB1 bacterium]
MKILLFTLLLVTCFFVATHDVHAREEFKLTLLHSNDGESHLLQSYPDGEDFGGIARLKTLVDSLKAVAEKDDRSVVLLSSGDNFLAGPVFNASLQRPPHQPFYDAVALDLIGYDAFCLGNHDFDFGPDVLARFIGSFSRTTAPFLCVNIDVSNEPALFRLEKKNLITKSTVLQRDHHRIGVIGAITPGLADISSPRNVRVNCHLVPLIENEIKKFNKKGINKIILISHLQSISEDSLLATRLSGIDIMIAGGGDELLINPKSSLIPGDDKKIYGPYPLVAKDKRGDNVCIVTTSGGYRYVGQLKVTFDTSGNITTVDPESGPLRVVSPCFPDGVKADSLITRLVTKPIRNTLTAQAHNIIAESEIQLDGRRCNLRTRETNLGNLIADALLWQARQSAVQYNAPLPAIAIQSAGSIRGDQLIPAGPVSELSTFALLPYPSFVTIIPNISPQQFKNVLENAVSKISRPAGRFLQISGFRMVWNPNNPAQKLDREGNILCAGNRIIDAALDNGIYIIRNGKVVDKAPPVDIAGIDFVARGGDQFPFQGSYHISLGITYQQACVNYLTSALQGRISKSRYPRSPCMRIISHPVVELIEQNGKAANYFLLQAPRLSLEPCFYIEYNLPLASNVEITLMNTALQKLPVLRDTQQAGRYRLNFNLSFQPAGVYVLQIKTGDDKKQQKILLLH